jgi:hypothetical protein
MHSQKDFVHTYTGHTQKNGAVSKVSLLKPHHSFVYALYIDAEWKRNGTEPKKKVHARGRLNYPPKCK